MMRRLFGLLAFALLLGFAPQGAAASAERDPDSYFFNAFLGDLRDELAQARSTGRKGVLVMYHFEECPSCQRMRRQVLNRPEVQDWFRREFVIVPIDIRGAQPITGVDGKTLPESAYGQAMGMTLGEVEEGFFADEPDTDGQPGDLMGGSGKGT